MRPLKKSGFPRRPGRKLDQEFSSTLTPDVNGGERSLPHSPRGAQQEKGGQKRR
ncbi:MAG: hypothetical protein LUH16_01220 [Clostridiales bacterium]|nr:hypothetical protein [Clostridiales bacterium]